MFNSFLTWFSRTWLFIWFCKVPGAHIVFRLWGYPKLPIAAAYFGALDAIANEDPTVPCIYAFVSADNQSLARKMVGIATNSAWSHAGVVLPNSPKETILKHMMGDGLMTWHILTLLRELDSFALVKFEFPGMQYKYTALERLHKFETDRVAYDYQQELNTVNKQACSEMLYHMLKGLPYFDKNGDIVQLTPVSHMGRTTFAPCEVYSSATKVLWEHIEK